MRKHFKNWSILATIIGGTVITGAPSAKADAGALMQGIDIVSRTYNATKPVLRLANDAGTAADAFSKKGASASDLASMDPDGAFGKLTQAKIRLDQLEKDPSQRQNSQPTSGLEVLDDNGNPISSIPLGLEDNELWKQATGYKVARRTLDVLLSPVHAVKYGLDKIWEARQASHKWLEELDNPNVFAKVGVLSFDILALPFTVTKYAIDWAVRGVYACLDYLYNPEISWATKAIKAVQLGLFVLAAKTAAATIAAAVVG